MKKVEESIAGYRDKIGFDVTFEYGAPTYYAGLCSGDVSLHLVDATADLDGNMIFFGVKSGSP